MDLEPVGTLVKRARAELASEFAGKTLRLSRAPGRLDVMGGIADYTGSLVCEATLGCAASVAMTLRNDAHVQVFSFNNYDEQQPFTVRIPIEALANCTIDQLRSEFAEPGRRWSGYVAGCLAILREQGYVDLKDVGGFNIALLSTVPIGGGVSSSAALEVATMMNFVEHFGIRDQMAAMHFSALCQMVENRVVGAPCGIMDQATSCAGEEGALMRMLCQPHELKQPLYLPRGIRAMGINSNVKHSVGGGAYGKTRCAAFMGHKMILDAMVQSGSAPAATLAGDPLKGYLANLEASIYNRDFRESLPGQMLGSDFIAKHGQTLDTATKVDPAARYHVRAATDHHVYEAGRVKAFAEALEHAGGDSASPAERERLLRKAGELMYASHLSYTDNALLGADECDLLVNLVRENESAGLYGAKITGGGSGGTVAVLAEDSAVADAALKRIMEEYETTTGCFAHQFYASSPGAWAVGTTLQT